MKQKKNFTTFVLFMISLAISLTACGWGDDSNDIGDDSGSNPLNNYLDVAVTGNVMAVKTTSATITGVANLDKINAFFSDLEIGVEVSTDKDFTAKAQTRASGLTERQFKVVVGDLKYSTTYYYRTYVKVIISSLPVEYLGATNSFTTSLPYEVVDLGLPSGTLWADRNIGADCPEAIGDFFAWGETTTKNDYSWSVYKYGESVEQLTKYCQNAKYGKDGFIDNILELEPKDDAAQVFWGDKWRIPNWEQIEELLNNTEQTWVENYNNTGINGYKFTSKKDATKYIFFPATGYRVDALHRLAGSSGYYWVRSLHPDYAYVACSMNFNVEGIDKNFNSRSDGHVVRPVSVP